MGINITILTFGVSAPFTIGAIIPGIVAAVLVMPKRIPAYLKNKKEMKKIT